jgi:hypothetical protein
MEGMQLVVEDYSTSDIIKAIEKSDKLFRTDTKAIAKTLKRRTELQTVKAVFDFVLKRVKYKLDVPGVQLARRPNRTLQEGKGDCKSFSLLTGSLLYNLGIDYSYRFVSYRPDPTPTHVYVVAHTKTGNVLVDGVWKIFNSEKPYQTKTDIRMKGLYIGENVGVIRKRNNIKTAMSVAINGLDSIPINGIGRRGKKNIIKRTVQSAKKVTTKAKTAVKTVAKKTSTAVKTVAKKTSTAVKTGAKAVAKGVVKVAKKGANLAKKQALVVPRNAFLLLVKVNFKGFATKLSQSDQGKLSSKWESLGGNWSALKKVIDSSKNKKRILGIGSTIYVPLSGISGIGEPVSVASAVASATAIIALLKNFLPKNAGDGASTEEQAQGEELAQAIESGTETSEQLEAASSAKLQTKSGNNVNVPNIERELVDSQEYNSTQSKTSTGVKVGVGVAVASALFLIMKKK